MEEVTVRTKAHGDRCTTDEKQRCMTNTLGETTRLRNIFIFLTKITLRRQIFRFLICGPLVKRGTPEPCGGQPEEAATGWERGKEEEGKGGRRGDGERRER